MHLCVLVFSLCLCVCVSFYASVCACVQLVIFQNWGTHLFVPDVLSEVMFPWFMRYPCYAFSAVPGCPPLFLLLLITDE